MKKTGTGVVIIFCLIALALFAACEQLEDPAKPGPGGGSKSGGKAITAFTIGDESA
jgi:hypothetical protein